MIAIVGGGVTGLGLAHQLAARGVEHVVLEGEERPGGVMRSGRVDGHLLEWGPQRTRLTAAMGELVARLGIADEVITAPPGLPLYVYRAGRLRRVPFSAADFLRTDLFSPAAKVRVLLEPFTAGARPEESVGSFFERKVGRQAYENLLGPLYGGLYASDPADMVVGLSLGHALREFGIRRSLLRPLLKRRGHLDPPPAVSFREGMQTLPLALHRANEENVRLATPVLRMRR
ncbi:MAG TPA: protoporphyrinogen oxidase, partial [Longimicrobiaceae bacterium]|nr:protoporphyrinogen oxidase [Longimicrobiaceae bacterium]